MDDQARKVFTETAKGKRPFRRPMPIQKNTKINFTVTVVSVELNSSAS